MATKAERELIDKTVAGQQALFVGSLATSISDEDLGKSFEQFGEVITAKVIMARDDPSRLPPAQPPLLPSTWPSPWSSPWPSPCPCGRHTALVKPPKTSPRIVSTTTSVDGSSATRL